MATKGDTNGDLRIVDQIRTMKAREYDLACGDCRLTVNVQALESGASGWRVEVRGKRRGGETLTTSESAPSRVEALRAAGREWQIAAQPRGINLFDWAAVEKLLDGVRAL